MRVIKLILILFLVSKPCYATADGPDYYSVRGVKMGESLSLRSGPGTGFPTVAGVPAATVLENMGVCIDIGSCKPPSYDKPPKGSIWCLVRFQDKIGWANARYLGEGVGPATMQPPVNSLMALNIDGLASSPLGHSVRQRLLAGRDEIYPFLIIQTISPGGEGQAAKLLRERRIDHVVLNGNKRPLADSNHYMVEKLRYEKNTFKFDLKQIGKVGATFLCVLDPKVDLPRCVPKS